MKGLLETKDNVGSVKDVDTEKSIVTGYLAIFGNVDHDNDITEPGAFAKSIRERGPEGKNKLVFLNFHNWFQIHNKFQVLQEDSIGLYFEAKLDKNISYSNDTLHLYQNGVIEEHSYGWVTIRQQEKSGIRHLQECYLYEGSNVALGANDQTRFTGFKSLTFPQMEEKIGKITSLIRHGNLTDEGFIQLELALKQLQSDAYELGKQSAPVDKQPLISTALESAPQPTENEAILQSLKNFTFN